MRFRDVLNRHPRERRMLLRSRIALTTALIVAVAIVSISTITWVVTQHNLRAQLDESMLSEMPPQPPPDSQARPPHDVEQLCQPHAEIQPLQRFLEGIQLVRPDGSTCAPSGVDEVMTLPQDRTATRASFRDGRTRSGEPVRVLIRPVGNGDLLLTSHSLVTINDTMAGLGNVLIVVSVLGAVLAAGAGLLLTRSALTPMGRLTAAAEHIARTEDLHIPVDVSGRDEVGRLGRAFTSMTAALAESRRRQRELVTDAAHELRTPLTSLRTNIDLLARSEHTGRPLPAGHRTKIIDSLQSQAGEFTTLINELVTLARDEHELERAKVSMATVFDRAVRRAASRTRDHTFDVDTRDWTVIGDAAALERLVLNLLDNAVKFSPPGSVVTLRSEPGWFWVSDQGSGIPERHREHVFDRFWRAPEARAMPGSGLGLAIVASTVAAHGGSVRLATSPGGVGTQVHVDLPGA